MSMRMASVLVILAASGNALASAGGIHPDSSGNAKATSETRPGTARASVVNFVLPSTVGSKEPFTFAAAGTVEGEVIDVKTVEGEVVETKKTDKYGRVFLPAGLASGAYLISRGSNSARMTVQDAPLDSGSGVQSQNWRPVSETARRVDTPLRLSGNGVNPDAAKLETNLSGISNLPVLASTSREVVLASPKEYGVGPGHVTISVRDTETGRTVLSKPVTLCSVSVQLAQSKVVSGSATSLIFRTTPDDVDASIDAQIVDGAVQFAGSATTKNVRVRDGVGSVPVQSIPGQSGPFHIGWMFSETKPSETFPIDDPRTDKVLRELEDSRRKVHVNSDKSKVIEVKDRKGRIVEKQRLNPKGEETYYESHDYDGNDIDRLSQEMKRLPNGGWSYRKVKKDSSGKVTSDETDTFDSSGSQDGGTRMVSDGKGGTKTETYDKDTNTWK